MSTTDDMSQCKRTDRHLYISLQRRMSDRSLGDGLIPFSSDSIRRLRSSRSVDAESVSRGVLDKSGRNLRKHGAFAVCIPAHQSSTAALSWNFKEPFDPFSLEDVRPNLKTRYVVIDCKFVKRY